MKTVELKIYPASIETEEELKKISSGVFDSLEKVVSQHEDYILVKRRYNDNKDWVWSKYLVTGKLIYKASKKNLKPKKNYLKIKFLAGYDCYNGFEKEYYNRIKIYSQGDDKKTNTEIIADLTAKFKSFDNDWTTKYVKAFPP